MGIRLDTLKIHVYPIYAAINKIKGAQRGKKNYARLHVLRYSSNSKLSGLDNVLGRKKIERETLADDFEGLQTVPKNE